MTEEEMEQAREKLARIEKEAKTVRQREVSIVTQMAMKIVGGHDLLEEFLAGEDLSEEQVVSLMDYNDSLRELGENRVAAQRAYADLTELTISLSHELTKAQILHEVDRRAREG